MKVAKKLIVKAPLVVMDGDVTGGGSGGGGGGGGAGGGGSSPWSISTYSLNSTAVFGNPTGEHKFEGLHFKPDGTTVVTYDFNGPFLLKQFFLPSPWDMNVVNHTYEVSAPPQYQSGFTQPYAYDVFIDTSGERIFTTDPYVNFGFNMYRMDMTTPWNISTASYVSGNAVNFNEGLAVAFFFSPDGTQLYINDDNSSTMYQYNLATPWDITTAVYTGKSFTHDTGFSNSRLYMRDDGLQFILLKVTEAASPPPPYNVKLYSYVMSTAWDISTASLHETLDIKPYIDVDNTQWPYGLAASPDGQKILVMYFDTNTTTNSVLTFSP